MPDAERPYEPSLPARLASTANIGLVGFLCHSFLYAFNRTSTTGLDKFLDILDEREDEKGRSRGLITVSNHVSVMDDPIMWGVLPYRYHWNPNNMRWSLGSYDICFKNGFAAAFFSYGNTLPTHRAAHSPYGGLFQPTMTQAIRLLSDPHSKTSSDPSSTSLSSSPFSSSSSSFPTTDPFSSQHLTYTTTGTDTYPAPSAYSSRRFSWVHIFPEGMIHQHPDRVMRYFKWGVARLILEAEPCPDLLPLWIDGMQHVMDDTRTWPRFLPRAGKDVHVTFGELVDGEVAFGEFRERWRRLRERIRRMRGEDDGQGDGEALGILLDEELRTGAEAEQLRIDVTLAVRNHVLKVRRSTGLPDEDPKRSLAATFKAEGGAGIAREGEKEDGSIVRDM